MSSMLVMSPTVNLTVPWIISTGTPRAESTWEGSSEADEQAIQRFTTTDCRRLLISGDENFDNAQIQKVEALETETYTRDMKE